MTAPNAQPAPRAGFKLTEDWLATIVGLVLVLIIGLGLLGPGGQSVALTAAPGANQAATIRPLSGWKVSATLNKAKIDVKDAPTSLEKGKTYVVTCQAGALSVQVADTLPQNVKAAPADKAQLVVVNSCDGDVALTYTMNPVIPWPIFKIF
jgi:Tfp pilus assembly protein PilV